MIISHTNQSIVMRVPKTGSTSLEASVRIAGCVSNTDTATSVEDTNIPELNIPETYTSFRSDRADLDRSIRKKVRDAQAANSTPEFTTEEQDLIDLRRTNAENGTFKKVGLHHATLDDLTDEESFGWVNLATEEQILSYDNYATIRNPLKRAISSYVFVMTRNGSSRVPFTIDDFHEFVLGGRISGMAFRKQIDYFKYKGETHNNGSRIVTPILFETYTDSVMSVISDIGGVQLGVLPKFKSNNDRLFPEGDKPTVETWIDPYPEVKQAILDFYAEDIALWEEVSGQSISGL